MRRREFVAAVGAAALAWPLAARAQAPTMQVIGMLSSLSLAVTSARKNALLRGLSESGLVEGRNVTIEIRLADGQYDRLPALAAELVRRRVNLIVTLAPPAAEAAKAATATIPIVFVVGYDPVAAGLVASHARPGGNATGVSFITALLGAKRLELARELVPNANVIAVLVNPKSPDSRVELKDLEAAAGAIGQQLLVLRASGEGDFDPAFAAFAQHRAGALLVGADPFFLQRRERIIALAAQHRIPAIYPIDEFATSGGLMSYGASISEAARLAGVYAGRILSGAKPADLPVLQPTKFELLVNLGTARALRLAIPKSILERADEVIE